MNYPKAVYLDTNILKRLRPKIDAPEFQEFKNICNLLKISIFIPQLVLDEWIYHFIEERGKKDIQKIDSVVNNVRSYIVSEKDISIKINRSKIIKDLKNSLENRIKKVGILVIQRPKVKIETLIKRAIEKVRPFTEGDKGFRDTIILYTILAHAKKLYPGKFLFLTDDGDFEHRDVKKTAANFNVNLDIYKSIEEAKVYLQKFLESYHQTYLKYRAIRAEKFLSEKHSQISAYINEQGAFSDMFFSEEFKKDPFLKNIKRINNIELVEIHKAKVGFLSKGEDKGWVEISFLAKLKFYITVEIFPIFEPTKHSVGRDRDLEIRLAAVHIAQEKELRDETLSKDLLIYAEALVDERANYYDFKIKNLMTY